MRRAMELLALSQLLMFFTLPAFAAEDSSHRQRARATKQVVVERGGAKQVVVTNASSSAPKAAAPAVKTWPPIKGDRRLDKDEALENALQKADEALLTYLRGIRPDTNWPQKELRRFVDRMRNKKTESNAAVADLTEDEKKELDGRDFFVAELELTLTASLNEELLLKLRHDEAKERQWWVTKGLLGVLALLATVGIYYRLDDRTKGYYTNLLRLGVLAALGTAGYGIAHLP